MKKLFLFFVIVLISCQKEQAKPSTPPVEKQTSSGSKLSAIFNYSTTVTSGTLSTTDLATQSVDTTYYQVFKNDVKVLEWKANWNYTSNSAYNSISNLSDIIAYNSTDVLTWTVIHRSPRNITGYSFNAGISLDGKRIISGQYIASSIASDSKYYKSGYNSFIQSFNYTVE